MSTAPRYQPHYTVDDYNHWEGDWELWFGTAVSMAPSPFGRHGSTLLYIGTALNNAIDSVDCNATAIAEVDWIVSNDTVVRPDLSVICGEAPKTHIQQPPGLIVEVLSDSTKDRDLDYKRELYQQNRVRWYLIADPVAESLIALCLNDVGQYEQIPYETTISMELCESCHFDLPTGRFFR